MAEGSEFRSGIRLPDGWDVRAYMGDVSTPTGLVVRSGGGERAYMGDVSTPTGLVVRSGGGERAYMGDVSTLARGNLADNQFFFKQLLKLKTVSKFVQSNHKNTKRWNRLQSLSIS